MAAKGSRCQTFQHICRRSYDGKWVVFSNFKEIYRVSVDDGVPEQLTSEGKVEVLPTWSPDGTSIEFSDFPYPGLLTGIKVLDLASKKVLPCGPALGGFMLPRGRPMANTWWQ